MTQYEACKALAELLKSYTQMNQLPVGAMARMQYAALIQKLFALAG